MRILFVATKLPWPPHDGGRLALDLTVRALIDAGHDIELVAPLAGSAATPAPGADAAAPAGCIVHTIAVEPHGWPMAALGAWRQRGALSVARHRHHAVAQLLRARLAAFRPDVVHAEQLQALANCAPAVDAGTALVLRMQNVESELWRQSLRARFGAALAALPSAALRAAERRGVRMAQRCVALTGYDARQLQQIAGNDHERVSAIAPAFPAQLAAGEALDGAPAVVLSGSAGWWPNTQALRWFVHAVAPALITALPQARVHVFGGADGVDPTHAEGRNMVWHAAPADSIEAFAHNAIAAVPLWVGSGIRMRILEAWARGLPVVATSIAARGLDAIDQRDLLIADTPAAFCAAIVRLAGSAGLRAELITAGRARLAAGHAPPVIAKALAQVYRQAQASLAA